MNIPFIENKSCQCSNNNGNTNTNNTKNNENNNNNQSIDTKCNVNKINTNQLPNLDDYKEGSIVITLLKNQ